MTLRKAGLSDYLHRWCRGRRCGRKAWKVAEDLRAAGHQVTEADVLAAAEALRRAGVPVVLTADDPPAVFLDEHVRRRDDRSAPGRGRRRRVCLAASCRRPEQPGHPAAKEEGQ